MPYLTSGLFHTTTLIPASTTVRVTDSVALALDHHSCDSLKEKGYGLPICHSFHHFLLSHTWLVSLTH